MSDIIQEIMTYLEENDDGCEHCDHVYDLLAKAQGEIR